MSSDTCHQQAKNPVFQCRTQGRPVTSMRVTATHNLTRSVSKRTLKRRCQGMSHVRDIVCGGGASTLLKNKIKWLSDKEMQHLLVELGIAMDINVEALFDVRVVDTDAPSHCHRASNTILESSLQEKKRMYNKAVEDRRDGHCSVLQVGQSLFHYKQLCKITACFCEGSAVSLCLRGSRIKWRSGLGFDDGAPLASFMD
ncbi:hypothetical protein EMCRGX_G032863 [Ephydatia muelleri]